MPIVGGNCNNGGKCGRYLNVNNHIHRKKRYTRHDAASMLSRMGAFKHANAYNYYLKYIKPKVSIHYCKRRLSTLARKNSEKVSDTA